MINNKFFAVILTVAIMLNTVCVNAAFTYITETYEPGEVEQIIEAEDFTGGGFSVVEDETASGGKVIIGSGNSNESMSYTLKLDSNVEKLTVYGVHKSSEMKQALSYISFEGFEHYSLYDYEYGKWNTTRLFFDVLSEGKYKINLTSVRRGQKIDKIIVKYNRVKSEDDVISDLSNQTKVDTSKYISGRPELEEADIAQMPEMEAGTFIGESEDGTYSKNVSNIVSDEKASGGLVWISTSKRKLENSEQGDTELAYKFYVSQEGSYKLWVRYNTKYAEKKDAYISIDGDGWTQVGDAEVTGEYKWKSPITADLAEGWHTIEVKHRNDSWFIDKFLLTNHLEYTPVGMGSLPSEYSGIDEVATAKLEENKKNPKIKSNNFRFRSDADFEFSGDDIMVPSTNIAAALGIFHQKSDDCFLLIRDREYLKFYDGSNRVIASGKVINTTVPSHMIDDEEDMMMVSLKAAQEAFGFDYEYDESENSIHIFDFYEESYVRTATDEELQLETGKKVLYYTIPYDNPNAKVEVWLKYNINDILAVRNMNWDNLNKLDNGGNTYQMMDQYSRHGANMWYRAQTPVYKDGAFRGVQFSADDSSFFVKVIITDNGKQDVFMKKSRVTQGWDNKLTPQEYKYNTDGELYLVPTFENISYYIDADYENADCKITYRKVGDAHWNEVFDPTFDFETNQFRGTVPFVNQDTEYEVKAVITQNGKTVKESTASVHTWKDNPPIAQTIKLKDIYSGGDLTVMGYKGTEDGWIKIDGEGMTVDAKKDFYEAVTITDCEYLIFENVVVRGGTEFGIIVDAKCHDVRIVNCDIAEWGTGSIQDPDFGVYYRVGTSTNQRSGIQAAVSRNFVVERCYIHDSDTNTNPWNNLNYTNTHPAGSTAIMMWGLQGTVIRYNDFVGSDRHRFNDVLEGASNGGRNTGSCGRDSDIYGNLLIFSNDDGMELDGAQMNVRVYQNRIENTYCGISTAPNTMGPSYLYRNMIVKLSDETGRSGVCVKIGGCRDPWTITYMFNNIFRTSGGCIRNSNFSGSTEWHGILRNNIIAAYNEITGSYQYGRALENKYADERDDYDYDLITGTTIIPANSEKNAVYDVPKFVNDAAGNFRPTEDSPTWEAGAFVAGFTNIDKPNIGPFVGDEYDSLFLPARPIDISSDVYVIKIKSGETGTANIKIGDIEDGHTYCLVKNRDFDFLTVENDEIENVALIPNSTIKINIKSETTGKGVVMLRLDNGYSVPIIIYCEN